MPPSALPASRVPVALAVRKAVTAKTTVALIWYIPARTLTYVAASATVTDAPALTTTVRMTVPLLESLPPPPSPPAIPAAPAIPPRARL